jgi:hypothetical protein
MGASSVGSILALLHRCMPARVRHLSAPNFAAPGGSLFLTAPRDSQCCLSVRLSARVSAHASVPRASRLSNAAAMQNPAPPLHDAAASLSLEETAFAAVGVAQRVVELLLAGCYGEQARMRTLACVDLVSKSLMRAARPHWRVLCWRVNASAAGALDAELAAALGATGGAGDATPASGVRCRWHSLCRQLLHNPPRALLHCCEDVRFHVDVRFRGALLFARCLGPFAGATHENMPHLLIATSSQGAPCARVTAGDVYDWPTHFTAAVHAQRRSDGAIATLAVWPPRFVHFLAFGAEQEEQRALRRLGSDETSVVLEFCGELPVVADEMDTNPRKFSLHVHLQAEDAALNGGVQAEPLFFHAHGFSTADLAWDAERPRKPRYITKDRHYFFTPDTPGIVDIPHAHLERPLVLRPGPLCTLLSFSEDVDYLPDGAVRPPEGSAMDCVHLRASLDLLVWKLP